MPNWSMFTTAVEFDKVTVVFGVPVMVKVAVFPGQIVCTKLVLVTFGNGFTMIVTELVATHPDVFVPVTV